MPEYFAYGLKLRSDIELPELPPASVACGTAPADVVIRIAPIDARRPDDFAPDSPAWTTPGAAFLDYPEAARFEISGGDKILICPTEKADENLIRLYLLGPAMGLILHQRQFLVLHASAVVIDGRAAAFVGDKGMGKSTFAAALHARGHALLADDLVAIDTSRQPPMARPGYPQLKLFPESAKLLGDLPSHLIHPDMLKSSVEAQGPFPEAPVPLSRVFVLEDDDHDGIIPMPGRIGFMELVKHTYLLGFLRATRTEAAHFRQAAALASRVPVTRLKRRRQFDALESAALLVEAELAHAA